MISSILRTVCRNVFVFSINILLLFSGNTLVAQIDGENLFKTNCAQCHYVNSDVLIGPGLKGVDERLEREYLYQWINNSTAVIKSGDKYAVDLFEKFNKVVMPNFGFSTEELDAIIAYIAEEGSKVEDVTAAGPGAGVPGSGEGEKKAPYTLIILSLSLFVLMLILGRIKRGLEDALRVKEGKPVPVRHGGLKGVYLWMRHNKKILALLLIIFFVYGSVDGWNRMANLGVYDGYQPAQPIKFSHKLHAGDNGISCVYCHSGASKSRHANIPSANVCMNCHKAIKSGPDYGEKEIAKIYAALDYDPQTQQYGPNQKPIQWVRVHNLPDLAYFNHAQHYNVGGIECQTCHGPVEEMEELYQHSELTMGWCIDCHITTEVNVEGNEYYTALHDEYKEMHGPDALFTVDKIGGMECARCHY